MYRYFLLFLYYLLLVVGKYYIMFICKENIVNLKLFDNLVFLKYLNCVIVSMLVIFLIEIFSMLMMLEKDKFDKLILYFLIDLYYIKYWKLMI